MRFKKKQVEEVKKAVKLLLPASLIERFQETNQKAQERGYEAIELSAVVARLLARELAAAERQFGER